MSIEHSISFFDGKDLIDEYLRAFSLSGETETNTLKASNTIKQNHFKNSYSKHYHKSDKIVAK